jgi:hypothetical protein
MSGKQNFHTAFGLIRQLAFQPVKNSFTFFQIRIPFFLNQQPTPDSGNGC